jgi:hypothetical protein
MELIYARDVNLELPDGTAPIIHEAITVCQSCLDEKNWAYTIYTNDQAGDKCEVCSA